MQTKSHEQFTKRVHWIDICRGIGIIFVLYGHLFVSDKNTYLIFAFHMPLFFFISGLVFKPTVKPLRSITIKYIKQLLIPYYLFAVLTYVFAFVSQTAGDLSLSGIAYQAFGILYGNGNNGMLGYNVVLWFLPCLFITKLAFALITKKVTQTKKIFAVLIVCATVGYLLAFFVPWLKLPFSFEIALTGLSFFGAGYLMKKNKQMLRNFMQHQVLLAITAMLFTIYIATLNYHLTGMKIDLRGNRMANVFLFYLGAFGGIVSWVTVSQILNKNAILEYIGRHSMIVFAWHNILFTDLQNFINSALDQDFLNNIQFIMPTLYVFTAMSIILFSRMLIVKLKGVTSLIKQ